jgi:adenylate cyclase
MRIRYFQIQQGEEKTFDSPASLIVIGRPKPGQVPVDLDLTPDLAVSRPHARISFENGAYWIEDLGSNRGTKVDDQEIKGRGKVLLPERNRVRVGDTMLFVEPPNLIDNATISPILQVKEPAEFGIGGTAETTPSTLAAAESASPHARLLYKLLLQSSAGAPLDTLFQIAVERLVAALPAADRGALLLKEPSSSPLLKAHLPPGEPSVSMTLAEHAMSCGGGFIWQRADDASANPASVLANQMGSGIYAPLTWRGETFGVICVDNCNSSRQFTEDDLEIAVAVAQHVALAIANHRLREDLQINVALIERLLTNFSPAIRRRLLDKARRGRLKLGGEKSEVTILSSDIRGFTATTAKMDAQDVVDMLNSYFTALVSAIFRHDGTVDKFIGDSILAVFGSPEPDADQHGKAIRAALAMQAAINEVNEARRSRGQTVCEMGIGIHCGEVLHGFIGSEERMEFTVIGDAVNRTSRYCDAAGPRQVLISPEMYQRVWKLVCATQTAINTKHEGILPAYSVEGIRLTSSSSTVAAL